MLDACLGTQGAATTSCILSGINRSVDLNSSPKGKEAWLMQP
jgi:hypothetical protein